MNKSPKLSEVYNNLDNIFMTYHAKNTFNISDMVIPIVYAIPIILLSLTLQFDAQDLVEQIQ